MAEAFACESIFELDTLPEAIWNTVTEGYVIDGKFYDRENSLAVVRTKGVVVSGDYLETGELWAAVQTCGA
jgi:hypothetical protein